MDDTSYTVGALARAGGLTVRTLHHWDAIGLLVPAERAGNGYRRYGREDVARLYRILALRRLGLSLDEIAAALEREGPGLQDAVRAHLARVEEQLAAQSALRDRLVRILDALGDAAGPSAGQLIETIEVMTMHEQYYTPEQLEQLAARREALGEEGMRKAAGRLGRADRRDRGRARAGHRSRRPARAGARRPLAGADPGVHGRRSRDHGLAEAHVRRAGRRARLARRYVARAVGLRGEGDGGSGAVSRSQASQSARRSASPSFVRPR